MIFNGHELKRRSHCLHKIVYLTRDNLLLSDLFKDLTQGRLRGTTHDTFCFLMRLRFVEFNS